jgi:methionyl-tRNA formyltransferase
MKLGVLASGHLGLNVLQQLAEDRQIQFVMTDKKSDGILSFCSLKSIACFAGNPREGASFDFIKRREIDVLVSVNYLFIIDKELIQHPKKMAFNIHGSLLPKYRGRTPHVWAIINNEKETGVTAHVIDEGCDTGDILEQIVVSIGNDDTGATILQKYSEVYFPLINRVLESVEIGNVTQSPQNHLHATYFGKRTPDDGKIDWNWQKERIYNWIRAQAHPYPGAFTILDGERIVIDAISFDDFGYSGDMPNGKILTADPIRVKTPNGAIVINKIRSGKLSVNEGQILM